MTNFPKSRDGAEQGFVAQTFDIYLDLDRKKESGYTKALPGRCVEFADGMGWEKMILITPFSQFRVYDLLKEKTDDLAFQDMIPDIIIPDYVQIQADKLIVRINKDLIGAKASPKWGYQCFVMGFSPLVSSNQVLNKDVKAFATAQDFGGGWDTYGDPPVMDCLVPEGQEQYKLLNDFRSEPYKENIQYTRLPFVFPEWDPKKEKPELPPTASKGDTASNQKPMVATPPVPPPPSIVSPPAIFAPVETMPAAREIKPVRRPARETPAFKSPGSSTWKKQTGEVFAGAVSDSYDVQPPMIFPQTNPKPVKSSTGNFIPVKKTAPVVSKKTTGKKSSGAKSEFIPIRKKDVQTDEADEGFFMVAPPTTGFIKVAKTK